MENSYDFVAGCLGGAAGVIVGHPFDTLKVRLQLDCKQNPVYKGTFDCLKQIIVKEGARGPYKGISSPLYSLTAINAIVFGVQGNVLRRMTDQSSLSSHFIAGSAAGLLQCSICGPMELVKTRMQMEGVGKKLSRRIRPVYMSASDCLFKIYKAEGMKGIGRGMNSTIIREVPAFGSYFVVYEWFCRFFTPEGQYYCPTWGLLVSGGLAGCAAWIISYPVDVIKSRIQADGRYKNGKFVYEYSGYYDCIRKSVARDGWSLFAKGLTPTLIRAFPTNAATFTVVEYCLRFLRPSQSEEERKSTLERSAIIAQLD